MLDIPANGEGLGWIVSHDLSQLLLIPGLQPSSIAAAAAGDQQALSYLRFRAQDHAAHPGAFIPNPFDRMCLEASAVVDEVDYVDFYMASQEEAPMLTAIFEARQTYIRDLFDTAASEGQLAAMKWMRAICPRTFHSESPEVMLRAADGGHLEMLKFLKQPRHRSWDEQLAERAAPHLECIKWMLMTDAPGGPCPCDIIILCDIAHYHGLPALQWFRSEAKLRDNLWNRYLVAKAVRMDDQAMLEWLRAQDPPVPWDAHVCEAAAACSNISMLGWMRRQQPPCPWDENVTRTASSRDLSTLQWLRAQEPPCPWDAECCAAAAGAGRLDILMWLRSQDPPCPLNAACTVAAANQPKLEVLEWLLEQICPLGPAATSAAAWRGDLSMLKWLHARGCVLDCSCLNNAALKGHPAVLEWLSEQGCKPTWELYYDAAEGNCSEVFKLLHQLKVCPPGHLRPDGSWRKLYTASLYSLMFLADIRVPLSVMDLGKAKRARQAHCTFHGLVRWSKHAVSDPSRGAHEAFNFLASDCSGQLLLTRLSLLPSELIDKIAVAAELQHDIFSPSASL